MWQDLKLLAIDFFETNRARKQGFCIGLAAGASILTFGFFNTLFALGCGLVGLYVGSKLDGKDDLVDKTLEQLDRILLNKIRR